MWDKNVGCVIEIHSCLGRSAIYVGHMLPRLLQLAVEYWTRHPGSGRQQQLSCRTDETHSSSYFAQFLKTRLYLSFASVFSLFTWDDRQRRPLPLHCFGMWALALAHLVTGKMIIRDSRLLTTSLKLLPNNNLAHLHQSRPSPRTACRKVM